MAFGSDLARWVGSGADMSTHVTGLLPLGALSTSLNLYTSDPAWHVACCLALTFRLSKGSTMCARCPGTREVVLVLGLTFLCLSSSAPGRQGPWVLLQSTSREAFGRPRPAQELCSLPLDVLAQLLRLSTSGTRRGDPLPSRGFGRRSRKAVRILELLLARAVRAPRCPETNLTAAYRT